MILKDLGRLPRVTSSHAVEVEFPCLMTRLASLEYSSVDSSRHSVTFDPEIG